MKKVLLGLALVLVAWQLYERSGGSPTLRLDPTSLPARGGDPQRTSPDALARAYQERSSGVQVQGEGVVAKVLGDDSEGARHQRFIVRLNSGQTILIAHNIDIAPRIESLAPGAPISFQGEYEWNTKGGLVHWTHHDPAGRHASGWIRYNSRAYQ